MITDPILNLITTILEMFKSGGIITYAITLNVNGQYYPYQLLF